MCECKPYCNSDCDSANGWYFWNGGACPVKDGTLVDIKYRDGEMLLDRPANLSYPGPRDASKEFWEHDDENNDIVAWRFAKGFKSPPKPKGTPIADRERIALRDQFAMAALTGFISGPEVTFSDSEIMAQDVKNSQQYGAKLAYAYADAMLKARES